MSKRIIVLIVLLLSVTLSVSCQNNDINNSNIFDENDDVFNNEIIVQRENELSQMQYEVVYNDIITKWKANGYQLYLTKGTKEVYARYIGSHLTSDIMALDTKDGKCTVFFESKYIIDVTKLDLNYYDEIFKREDSVYIDYPNSLIEFQLEMIGIIDDKLVPIRSYYATSTSDDGQSGKQIAMYNLETGKLLSREDAYKFMLLNLSYE